MPTKDSGIFEKHLNPYAAGGLFSQYKVMQKNWKIAETLAHGYSCESTLSNEYRQGRV